MSLHEVVQSATLASNQAVEAVNVIQRRGIRNDQDRYEENLALAVANLSIAVRQLAEAMNRQR